MFIGANNDEIYDRFEQEGIDIAKRRDCTDCWLDIDISKLRKYFDIVLVSEHLTDGYITEHKLYPFDRCFRNQVTEDTEEQFDFCPVVDKDDKHASISIPDIDYVGYKNMAL